MWIPFGSLAIEPVTLLRTREIAEIVLSHPLTPRCARCHARLRPATKLAEVLSGSPQNRFQTGPFEEVQAVADTWLLGLMLSVLLLPVAAGASPIEVSATWNEFSFHLTHTEGCKPADPSGGICVPPSSDPARPAPAPPWTFTAPAEGVVLFVTDIANYGARFDVFDFGVLIGSTSEASDAVGGCGYEPWACFLDPLSSSGRFALGVGPHELTLVNTEVSGGAAHFMVRAVPEPGPGALLGMGLALLPRKTRASARRTQRKNEAARIRTGSV